MYFDVALTLVSVQQKINSKNKGTCCFWIRFHICDVNCKCMTTLSNQSSMRIYCILIHSTSTKQTAYTNSKHSQSLMTLWVYSNYCKSCFASVSVCCVARTSGFITAAEVFVALVNEWRRARCSNNNNNNNNNNNPGAVDEGCDCGSGGGDVKTRTKVSRRSWGFNELESNESGCNGAYYIQIYIYILMGWRRRWWRGYERRGAENYVKGAV